MKKIYFVRHGMTSGNEIRAYQKLDTPLSENGRVQANFLAERFSRIPFEVLISSPMERAQETARAIGKKTGHLVISETLFHEALRPSSVRGKSMKDKEVLEIIKITDSYWQMEGKRHSDEENFYDLKSRAIKALDYLLRRDEEIMVVVTHGQILKMLLAVMMMSESVQPDFWDKIDHFFFLKNTGITWIEYDNKENPNRWQLISWNDHAHLG